MEKAEGITVEQEQVEWADWDRTSFRGDTPQKMQMGGLVGSAVLREVRTILLAGSLIHVGKACVFGQGRYVVG